MEAIQNLIRPKTFRVGGIYKYLTDGPSARHLFTPQKFILVTFVAYDVCPAYVIVKNGSDERWRCLRDQIFQEKDPI